MSGPKKGPLKGSVPSVRKPTAAHQPGPRAIPNRPSARPSNAAAKAIVAVDEAERSTQVPIQVAQSGPSWSLPPDGTVCVTSWIPVNDVWALSQETVANGSAKPITTSVKRAGEVQRAILDRAFGAVMTDSVVICISS